MAAIDSPACLRNSESNHLTFSFPGIVCVSFIPSEALPEELVFKVEHLRASKG